MNGTISFPKISLTFKKPKGVIAYFHPTVIDRRRVPSSWGLQYLAIIGLYAASGYIVIMPDYIGLTEPYAHPYVIYPQQNVRSMISALNNQSSVI